MRRGRVRAGSELDQRLDNQAVLGKEANPLAVRELVSRDTPGLLEHVQSEVVANQRRPEPFLIVQADMSNRARRVDDEAPARSQETRHFGHGCVRLAPRTRPVVRHHQIKRAVTERNILGRRFDQFELDALHPLKPPRLLELTRRWIEANDTCPFLGKPERPATTAAADFEDVESTNVTERAHVGLGDLPRAPDATADAMRLEPLVADAISSGRRSGLGRAATYEPDRHRALPEPSATTTEQTVSDTMTMATRAPKLHSWHNCRLTANRV